MSQRGVRHGQLNMVSVEIGTIATGTRTGAMMPPRHRHEHIKPKN